MRHYFDEEALESLVQRSVARMRSLATIAGLACMTASWALSFAASSILAGGQQLGLLLLSLIALVLAVRSLMDIGVRHCQYGGFVAGRYSKWITAHARSRVFKPLPGYLIDHGNEKASSAFDLSLKELQSAGSVHRIHALSGVKPVEEGRALVSDVVNLRLFTVFQQRQVYAGALHG